jgi:hypothetical protein
MPVDYHDYPSVHIKSHQTSSSVAAAAAAAVAQVSVKAKVAAACSGTISHSRRIVYLSRAMVLFHLSVAVIRDFISILTAPHSKDGRKTRKNRRRHPKKPSHRARYLRT